MFSILVTNLLSVSLSDISLNYIFSYTIPSSRISNLPHLLFNVILFLVKTNLSSPMTPLSRQNRKNSLSIAPFSIYLMPRPLLSWYHSLLNTFSYNKKRDKSTFAFMKGLNGHMFSTNSLTTNSTNYTGCPKTVFSHYVKQLLMLLVKMAGKRLNWL